MRTVLCFGDSNTHGTMAHRHIGDRRRLERARRWPSVMGAALGADYDVIVEGHPGRTTVYDDPIEGAEKSGLRALKVLLESHRPIDLVLVMLGTNDTKARFGQSAADIALGVQRLALEIGQSDCGPEGQPPNVMLLAPVRLLETGIFVDIFAGAAEKSAALPKRLKKVAQRLDFGFVDVNDVAQVDPVDGIHLDAANHAKIGAHVAAAVTSLIAPNS